MKNRVVVFSVKRYLKPIILIAFIAVVSVIALGGFLSNSESDEEQSNYCVLSVNCYNAYENAAEGKKDIIPKDGIIYPEQRVKFDAGESVFDVLLREMKNNKIHIDFSKTAGFDTVYVKGIGNLYDGDCGEMSGWMYKVNGEFADRGCDKYTVSSGDKIEFMYSCDFTAEMQ